MVRFLDYNDIGGGGHNSDSITGGPWLWRKEKNERGGLSDLGW